MEGTHENQNKHIETRSEVLTSSLALFNQSSHFSYLYKKTEKLVSAIYMITNFIKDGEPLKLSLRESALKLLSLNRAFTSVSLSDRKGLMKEYQGIALQIISLATVASYAGLISEMNASVISREFNALVALVEKDENKKANEETVAFDSSFFQVAPQSPISTPVAVAAQPSFARENVLYTQPAPERPQTSSVDKGHAPISKVEAKPEYLVVKDIPKESREAAPRKTDSKDSRQAVILKILSKKGGLNIKDFVDSIKGVSAKTIQRELLSMVASGTLKKEGERRWSTYSLAN